MPGRHNQCGAQHSDVADESRGTGRRFPYFCVILKWKQAENCARAAETAWRTTFRSVGQNRGAGRRFPYFCVILKWKQAENCAWAAETAWRTTFRSVGQNRGAGRRFPYFCVILKWKQLETVPGRQN